jgi:hypothetical protein
MTRTWSTARQITLSGASFIALLFPAGAGSVWRTKT